MSVLDRLAALRDTATQLAREARAIRFQIPGRNGPLWQVHLQMQSEPEGHGERLKLRAHFKLSLRSKAPTAPQESGQGAGLPALIAQWIERRLDTPLMQRLAAPLLDRDLNTWVEVQTSTAALDAGARALLPAQFAQLGLTPKDDQPIQAWAGELRGARPGFAQMTLLQLDRRHLPPEALKSLGGESFQLSAAVVNVIEHAR